jgi:signal transduction histidine kinase
VNPGSNPAAAPPLPLDEASLQRALEVGQVVVWRWDLATGTVTCSDGAREFFGVDIGVLADFQKVFHPADLERVEDATRPVVERGGDYEVTYRLRRPGDAWRWVQSRGRVELGADGRPAQVLGTTIDITGQVRAERVTRLLAHAGEVLNASLDVDATLSTLAEVVVPEMADWYSLDLLDERGDLRRVAVVHPDPARVAEAEELYRRYPPLRGAPGQWQVIESREIQWAAQITDEQLQAGAVDEDHLRLIRSLQPRSFIMLPLVAHGAALGVLTLVFAESGRRYGPQDVEVARDLARRAAVAVDNARLFAQLQLADRRKDEFLAMLAHELRNPLAPISTAAQLLRLSARDPQVVCQSSEIISRQIAHMTDLVDDLLDVSRVTRGLIRVDRAKLDLRDTVAAAVEQVNAALLRRSQRLEQDVADEPLCVEGDAARLVQVLSNLLTNASKYTPPDGRISLRAWAEDGQVLVSVSDTGCGIEPALLPHVFELFTQGRRTPDRTQGGLGIGLALVCSIVRLHDGQIDAYSDGPGRGSRFVLRLPRVESAAPVADAPAVAPDPARPAAGTRFLVVDDNADAASSLAQLLRTEGYQAVVAFDAEEALGVLRDSPAFDVCVLDIGLPDMTGHELARRILAAAPRRPLLVALTGYGQPEDREESLHSGFDHHLVKPVAAQALLSLVAADPSAG